MFKLFFVNILPLIFIIYNIFLYIYSHHFCLKDFLGPWRRKIGYLPDFMCRYVLAVRKGAIG